MCARRPYLKYIYIVDHAHGEMERVKILQTKMLGLFIADNEFLPIMSKRINGKGQNFNPAVASVFSAFVRALSCNMVTENKIEKCCPVFASNRQDFLFT
jgi:hypothetical protein